MDKESKILIDSLVAKKRPPKLKALDRSISIAIDNYTPTAQPPTMIIDDSLILEEPPPNIQHPATILTTSTKPEIYFVSSGNTSQIAYDDYPHYPIRKSTFRRSDTLDVHSPSQFQMRKTHSFHSEEPTVEEFLLASRRTSSVRGSYLFPPTKEIPKRSPSPNRRSCRMHRSFNEPTKRTIPKNELTVERLKFPSLNDELLHQHHQRQDSDSSKLAPPYDSTNISIENEIIRSRSNSRTRMEDEVYFERVQAAQVAAQAAAVAAQAAAAQAVAVATASAAGASGGGSGINNHKHKHSSHSLDYQHSAQHSFKRGGKHTHSLYLSPKSLDELQVHHRSLQGTKKSHSASLRVRPYRESLSVTKKSKSFIVDTYPEYELSPHRRDSRILITDDIKRSPRPSAASMSSGGVHSHHSIVEEKRPSFERKQSITAYDVNDVDFDPVLRPFRQSRRKSSLAESMKKVKKKSISEDTDEDEESHRKRKRIVCIIMTVFLCLVCASVFVVIITLTHSSVTQVQNQTRKVYTFSRDSPIHYNVRQENERLMQESMNRARFAKNFTAETASLMMMAASGSAAATSEGIP